MNIRGAKINDAAALSQLLGQLGYPATLEDCIIRIEQYQQPYHQLWIGEVDHQPIAFIALLHYYAIHNSKPIGRIVAFCVDENFRARGLGSQLLVNAENYFKEQGCFKLELTSNLKRTASHEYYKRRGYQQVSKHFIKPL